MYDFEASSKSELTFKEGDIVKVLRTKTPSGGDDGWWEGEICGKVGLFPFLVVEPLKGTFPESNVQPSTISPVFPYFGSAQPLKERLEIIKPESKSLLKPLTPEMLGDSSQKKTSNLTKDKNKSSERKDSEAAFKLSGNINK